ncbi:MAG TPA: hypothetical protein VFU47_07435, partial [Armatimonadota bacterium]|nr:hypothetical protein [Armatimonadota bacterium]
MHDSSVLPEAAAPARPSASLQERLLARAVPLAVAIAALVYLVTLLLLPRDGFWVVDNENKFLQMEALIRSGYRSAVLPYPGHALDPEFQFRPIPAPFGIVQEDQIFSQYPVYFALVSSLPYRLLGFDGLYVLPLLAGLGMLFAVARLGRWLGLSRKAQAGAVLLTAFASPLWFYSVNFWEHTLALCLCLWGVAFCFAYAEERRERDLALGAALMAASLYFREELLLFVPPLLAVMLLQVRKGEGPDGSLAMERAKITVRFVGVLLVAMVPLFLLNQYYTGHTTGMHATENMRSSTGLLGHLAFRPVAFYRLFIALHYLPGISYLLAAPYLLLFFWNPRLDDRRFLHAVPLAAAAATVSFGVT